MTALNILELFDMCALPAGFQHPSEGSLEGLEKPGLHLAKLPCVDEFTGRLLLRCCEDLFISQVRSEDHLQCRYFGQIPLHFPM